MKFSTLIAAAGALIGAVSGANLPLKRGQFYLQTSSTVPRFHGLWLYAYHTGAGLNDAVLSKNSSYRIPSYLARNSNPRIGGNLTFDLSTEFPWSLELGYQSYTAFSEVRINAGGGIAGFSFRGDTLQFDNAQNGGTNNFGGWLVCDWWHTDIDNPKTAAPQLFWRQIYYKDYVPPNNCAKVDLIKKIK